MKKISFIIMFLALAIPSITLAHPGRTDSSGCHTCKTNCPNWGLSYGEYHCHNAKALPQPKTPIKSTYGAQGTGYTKPAPEYKIPKEIKKDVVALVPKKAPEKVEKKSFWARLFGF
jgi:hypothetical protein